MGRFVITMPAVSYARELWRYGEPELAGRAATMSPTQCADVGKRAGDLSLSGAADRMWPTGPRGHTRAILLAVIESLEGQARPCARSRRLPEKSLPSEWQLAKDDLWAQAEAVDREMTARLHSDG